MNIVFDIGGTNMRVATAEGKTLGEIRKVPTPKEDPKVGVVTLVALAKELAAGKPIEAAAGSVAGSIGEDGVITDARNLRAWQGTNFAAEVSAALGVPAKASNDGGVVGLGEALEGAGKGFARVAYITVSTGVGGGLIENGVIKASGGVGHTPVGDSDLELSVSGTAVEKKFGFPSKELDSLDERNKLADLLAEGLSKMYEQWKPDVFVLGGSMIVGVNPIPLERVSEKFTTVPVKMAELKDNGGLIGGSILAEQIRPGVSDGVSRRLTSRELSGRARPDSDPGGHAGPDLHSV